jgi:putative ABC transport system permease protein
MGVVRSWLVRVLALFGGRRRDLDLADELNSHLDAQIDDNIRAGMTHDEARRSALAACGGIVQASESYRQQVSLPFVETTMLDLQYGWRMLRKTPGFSAVAITTLALGIGANTAIFSVINAVLIEPLPFKDPSRLVVLWEEQARRPGRPNVVGPANYLRWRERATSFENMSAFTATRLNLTGAGVPIELATHVVTTGFFETLGVSPIAGRMFTAQETTDPAATQVVMLSHALWSSRFGSDATIAGRTIQLGGRSFTVAGVMPSDVRLALRNGNGTKPPDVWVPLAFSADARQPRGRGFSVIARLKPGVSIKQARAEMLTIAKGLQTELPAFDTGWTNQVVPLRDELAGEVKPALLVLAGAVGFVLLIACANVANLLLARGARRQQEISVRCAIGAGRSRVMRQLLTESLLLGALGGIAGLVFARWTIAGLVALSPIDVSQIAHVRLSYPVLAFTGAVSLFTAILAGLAPAFETSRADFTALKSGVRQIGSDVRRRRWRHSLIVAELALAVVLLIGAGLMLRSFASMRRIDTGFDAHNVLTMRVTLPGQRYSAPGSSTRFFQEMTRRVRALPGVDAAGTVSFLPFSELGAATGFGIVGRPLPPLGQGYVTDVRVCDQGYFDSMHIALRRGRWFTERELREQANVVIINEALARQYFPDQDPIGQRLSISMTVSAQAAPTEIVGVVADVRYGDLTASTIRPMSYWPHPQLPYPAMTLTVRAAGNPLALSSAIEREIQSLDKDQPVADVRTMEQWMARELSRERFSSTLLAAFALLALLLASIGIYGVMSYAVSQRQAEIGVRLALGAEPQRVRHMILGTGLKLVVIGLAIGLGSGLLLSRALTSLLYQTSLADPVTLVSVIALLGAVATLAIYFPARRASRLNPIVALRAD